LKDKSEDSDIAERVGDAIIGFYRALVYHGLGALIAAIKGGREARQRIGGAQVERPLYSPFEKRGIEYKDFVILETQMMVLLLFVASMAFVFDLLSLKGFVPIGALLGLCSAALIQREVRKEFAEDFKAYQEFFYSYISISLLLAAVKAVKPNVNAFTPYLHLVIISLIAVAVLSVGFKRRHGRDYTFGRVLKGGKIATVKVNYDIRANVKPGIHKIERGKGLKKGAKVKLEVEQGFLNLKGGTITGLKKK